MKSRQGKTSSTATALINLLLIVLTILPFSVAGIWGAIIAHTKIFPIDPDVPMPPFPQGVAFILFLFLGLLLGGLLGGFIWAAVAKQFMTRDEVYQQAGYGVRIPVLADINKKFLRWLYRNEAGRR